MCYLIKATLAKINVFKGNVSKRNEGTNVHPCNSFVGQTSSHANFHMGANVRGAGGGGHMSIHHVFQYLLIC